MRLEGRGVDLFLGPVFTAPVTEKLLHEYFEETKTPPAYQEAMAELICDIPINSHARFVRLLLLLHLIFNGKEAKVEDFYVEEEQNEASRSQRLTETAIDAKENEESRSSYAFEKELYHHIQQGDPKRLQRFLEQTRSFPSEGKLAHTPLRQAKNTLIGMLMDFCARCGAAKLPKGVSAEIYRCMTYIQSHTNMPIGVEDVADEIHRSSSYLMRRFKAELGMSVGDYITKCKLEEACDLLVYGDRSLAEISAYLGYSSQSYFQNVFKKQFGLTPMQYRKQNRKAN